MELVEATSQQAYSTAIGLFKEYAAYIAVDLSFQDFDKELAEIEQQYARPNGLLGILYNADGQAVGCFGIRKFADSICELKRMYLKEEARGKGLGKKLLTRAIELGRELEYTHMRLDTLPSMESAIGLYTKMGFYEIEPYRFNPIVGTKYFEIQLKE